MNKFFFNNARAALLGGLIAKSEKFEIKKIAIPELVCDVVPRTLISNNFELSFYPVKSDLSVDQSFLKENILTKKVDMVIDISFFGTGLNDEIYKTCVDNGKFYCGDLCHQTPSELFLQNRTNEKTFFISSPRKMNGLKLGGILYTDLKKMPTIFKEVSSVACFTDKFLSKFVATKKTIRTLFRNKNFYSDPSLLREKKWGYRHYTLMKDIESPYRKETNNQQHAIESGLKEFCPKWQLKKKIEDDPWVYALATKDGDQQKELVHTLNKLGVLSSIWPVLPEPLIEKNKKYFFVIIPLLDNKYFDFSKKDFWDEVKKIYKI